MIVECHCFGSGVRDFVDSLLSCLLCFLFAHVYVLGSFLLNLHHHLCGSRASKPPVGLSSKSFRWTQESLLLLDYRGSDLFLDSRGQTKAQADCVQLFDAF